MVSELASKKKITRDQGVRKSLEKEACENSFENARRRNGLEVFSALLAPSRTDASFPECPIQHLPGGQVMGRVQVKDLGIQCHRYLSACQNPMIYFNLSRVGSSGPGARCEIVSGPALVYRMLDSGPPSLVGRRIGPWVNAAGYAARKRSNRSARYSGLGRASFDRGICSFCPATS